MALKLIAFVCLVSVALAKHESQSQLRGSIQQSDPAAKAVVEAKVEKVAAGKAKESTLHLKTSGDKVVTDNTAREGLGENLPYPGVDYLGIGYDLLRGNPEGDKRTFIDPGFRIPVIELEWKQVDPFLSRDYQNLQPVGGWALPETSCNQAQTCTTASSMEEYESELGVQVAVSGGYEGGVSSAAFSASVESESFQSDVVEKNSERFALNSYCLKFHVGLNKGKAVDAGFKPTANFIRRTKDLPKISQPTSCGTAGTECWDLKSAGNNKFLTVKNGSLVFAKKPSSATKWQFNSKSKSALLHLASHKAIHFKLDAEGKGKVELVEAEMGSMFKFNNSEIVCANCKSPRVQGQNPGDTPAKRKSFNVLLRATKGKFKESKSSKGNKGGVVKVSSAKKNATTAPQNLWELAAASTDDEMAWSDFFEEFGTHFIDDLHLGGKMSFQVTMTEDAKKKVESAGLSIAAEVSGAYGPTNAGVSAGVQSAARADNAFSNTAHEEKTVVLGGNPPEDPRTGFGEWAASVSEHPMPVKYKLRPLYAAGSAHVDKATYNIMLDKYMNQMLSKRAGDLRTARFNGKNVAANGTVTSGDPITLRPGESWSSENANGYSHKGTKLIIQQDGAIVIKSKTDMVLWDSLSTDWGCGDASSTERLTQCTGVVHKPYTLKYENDGDLTLKDAKGKMLWHSVTDSNTCGGKMAGKVVFGNGQMTVEDNTGKITWSTMTNVADIGGDGAAQKSKHQFFGPGDNKCLTDANCIKVWGDEDLKGSASIAMGPNKEYLYSALSAKGMNDYDYSIQVAKGRCWVEAWEENDLTGTKDAFTQDSVETTYVKGRSGAYTFQGSNDANSYRTHSTADYQEYEYFKYWYKKSNGYYDFNYAKRMKRSSILTKNNAKMLQYFPTKGAPSQSGMPGGAFSS